MLRTKRNLLATGATLLGALALTGCTTVGKTSSSTNTARTSSTSSSKPSAGNVQIAAVIKPLNNPYFAAMDKGIKDADSSANVQAGQSITDTSGQANLLSTLAGQNYGCYIVNPISGTNLLQGIAHLKAQGKTVVNIDLPVDMKAAKAANAVPVTYIGTDNIKAGEMAGKYMATLIKPGEQIGIVAGIAGDVTSQARMAGFKKGLGGKGKVVSTQNANWDRPTALTKATDMLRANPHLAGFFVANDDMAIGVARAVANDHLAGKVKIVSVDGIPDGLKAVADGQLTATVAQYPYAMGKMGVEACRAVAAGKKLPANITAPVSLITKSDAKKAIKSAPQPFMAYTDPLATK